MAGGAVKEAGSLLHTAVPCFDAASVETVAGKPAWRKQTTPSSRPTPSTAAVVDCGSRRDETIFPFATPNVRRLSGFLGVFLVHRPY